MTVMSRDEQNEVLAVLMRRILRDANTAGGEQLAIYDGQGTLKLAIDGQWTLSPDEREAVDAALR